ncbi:putative membrane protein [Butyrivibrio proteoclasticus]|uniref:Putative membrane protein n=1 Tax=Butyrivibrio proteoclasticus TaxID=43305 RepID=A0A1I5UT00_9FIRM|nr:hypothetical protein [Butyrivibrio proteoclasticus]SFP98434.1 putative membrane protein [Butyrivibrio proteoclasticus]
MIRKSLMKSFSVIMAAMLAMMSVACGANTVTDETAAVETQAESEIEESMVTNSAVASSESEAGKVETVYVKTDANGAVNDVIVSEWLKNADASSEMSDTTELKDIVNVKGSETFTDNGDGTLTWNASGADIYYQGTTDKELPVNMKITYTLDGKEISPEELAGKSGRVTIRFDYENKEKQTVEVNGKEIEVYTPFAMVSGMMLDSDKFSNVEISNGKVISDGGNYVVMGVAVPGLKESLDIDDEKWEELNEDGELDEKLTNHFEVTADTTDFELGMTITMASSDILSDFGLTDLSDSDKLDDLKDDMGELNDGSTKLVDGSKELKDGTTELRDGVTELYDGTKELKNGTSDLKDGTVKLYDGTSKLYDGTGSLYDGTGKLCDGTGSLKDGIVAYTDGASKINDGAAKLADGASSAKAGSTKLKDGLASAKTGATTLAAGSKQFSDLLSAKLGGFDETKIKELSTQLEGLKTQSAMYHAAYNYLISGGECSDELYAFINTLAGGKIESKEQLAQMVEAGKSTLQATSTTSVTQQANGDNLEQDVETDTITNPENGIDEEGIDATEETEETEEVEETQKSTQDATNATIITDTTTEDAATDTTTSDTTATDTTTADTTAAATDTTTADTTAADTITEDQLVESKTLTTGTTTLSLDELQNDSLGQYYTDEEIAAMLEESKVVTNEDIIKYIKTNDEGKAYFENLVKQATEQSVKQYLEENKATIISNLKAQEIADVIKTMDDEKLQEVVGGLDPVTLGKVMTCMDTTTLGALISKMPVQTLGTVMAGVDSTTLGAIIANMDADTLVSIMSTMDDSKIASLISSPQMLAKLGSIMSTPEGQAALAPIMTPVIKEQVMKNAPVFTSYGQLVGATKAGYTAIDQVLAKVQASGLDVSSLGKIQEAVAAAKQIADGSAALSNGINQLYDGAGTLDDGLGQLSSGASQLHDGTKELVSNNGKLVDGASQLNDGAAQLKDGAYQLKDGAYQLNDGARQLDDGAGKLNDGAIKLNDGVGELNDGVIQLDDGVQELLDGVIKLDEEGIKKLYEAFDGDLTEFADRMTAIKEAGENYTSFGGASEDIDSSVKFIIKTDAIKSL